MAFQHRSEHKIRSEINLTPLIDVMTSLLAIFMLTAPMMTSGIDLSLPKGDGKAIEKEEEFLNVSLTKDGNIFLGETKVSLPILISKLDALLKENQNLQIMIGADKETSYGQVIELLSFLKINGFEKVGLKTDMAMADGSSFRRHQSGKKSKRK